MTSVRIRGATLGEVLAAMAIVIIVLAISIPVATRVRRSARIAQVGGQLRQIGQARAIYMGDNDDAFVMKTEPLVHTGLITPGLLLNPLDPNPKGFREMLENWGVSVKPRRSSYSELGYWIGEPLAPLVANRTGAGWLVAPHFERPWTFQQTHFPEGVYSRLLLDGAVVRRTYRETTSRFSAERVFMDDQRDLLVEYRGYE